MATSKKSIDEANRKAAKAKADAKTAREQAKAARAEAAKAKAEAAAKAASQGVNGFVDFIREKGVVGLAIGLAIGTQANSTVKSIVDGLINPIVGFILGSSKGLTESKWHLVGRDTEQINYWFTLGDRQLVFGWGEVLSSLITLLAVAAVIYFVVMGLGLDKLDKKKE